MIGEPLLAGISNVIVACPLPRVAWTLVGTSGTRAGVMALLVPEVALVPIVLVAVTVKVYATPFVRPVTMIHEVAHVAVCPPLDVTV